MLQQYNEGGRGVSSGKHDNGENTRVLTSAAHRNATCGSREERRICVLRETFTRDFLFDYRRRLLLKCIVLPVLFCAKTYPCF